MDPWPFEDEDWDRFASITGLAEAILADDEVLAQSIREEKINCLQELERKYGEHPALLESLADILEDQHERLRLYCKALDLATKHEMPSLTIRIWLAELLVEEFGDSAGARRVLKDGGDEFLAEDQDPWYSTMFADLWWRCRPQEEMEIGDEDRS